MKDANNNTRKSKWRKTMKEVAGDVLKLLAFVGLFFLIKVKFFMRCESDEPVILGNVNARIEVERFLRAGGNEFFREVKDIAARCELSIEERAQMLSDSVTAEKLEEFVFKCHKAGIVYNCRGMVMSVLAENTVIHTDKNDRGYTNEDGLYEPIEEMSIEDYDLLYYKWKKLDGDKPIFKLLSVYD